MKWFVLALFVVLTTTVEAATRQQPEGVPGRRCMALPDTFIGPSRSRSNSDTRFFSGTSSSR